MSKNPADFLFSPIKEQDDQFDQSSDSESLPLSIEDENWALHSNGNGNGGSSGGGNGEPVLDLPAVPELPQDAEVDDEELQRALLMSITGTADVDTEKDSFADKVLKSRAFHSEINTFDTIDMQVLGLMLSDTAPFYQVNTQNPYPQGYILWQRGIIDPQNRYILSIFYYQYNEEENERDLKFEFAVYHTAIGYRSGEYYIFDINKEKIDEDTYTRYTSFEELIEAETSEDVILDRIKEQSGKKAIPLYKLEEAQKKGPKSVFDYHKELSGSKYDISNQASIRSALILALKSSQWITYKEVIQQIEQSKARSGTACEKQTDCLILSMMLSLAQKSEIEGGYLEETRNMAINCTSLRDYILALETEIVEKKAKAASLREKNQKSNNEKQNLEKECRELFQVRKELDRKKRALKDGKEDRDLFLEQDIELSSQSSKSLNIETVARFLKAITGNKLGEMSKMLAEFPELLDAYDENGKTCLMFSVAKSAIHPTALLLVEEGNRKRTKQQNIIFKYDKEGYRAIDIAILLGNLDMVKLLLKGDSDSFQILKSSTVHIVDRVARIGQLKTLKYLLEDHPERNHLKLVKKAEGGLLRIALQSGNKEIADYLLKFEPSVARTMLLLPDAEGETLLMAACNTEGSKQGSELSRQVIRLCLEQNPLQILHKSKISIILQLEPDLEPEFDSLHQMSENTGRSKAELLEEYALKIFIYDRLYQFLENSQSKAFQALKTLFEVQNSLIMQALGQLHILNSSISELQEEWRQENEIAIQIVNIKNEINKLKSELGSSVSQSLELVDRNSQNTAIQKLYAEAPLGMPRFFAGDSIELEIYTELKKGQDLNIDVFRRLLREDKDVLFATIGIEKEESKAAYYCSTGTRIA